MEYYDIQSGIPIPDQCHHGRYPGRKLKPFRFDIMQVGDSFAVPEGSESGRLRSAVTKFTGKHPHTAFTTRKLAGGGLRIWRVK